MIETPDEIVPLREIVARLEPGASLDGLSRPAAAGECGVLKISAVTTGQFLPNENKSLAGKVVRRFGPSPEAGDLLVSRANTASLVGAAALVGQSTPWLTLPDKIWRLQLADSDRDSARWLYYTLCSQSVRKALRRRATGTGAGMKNISQHSFLGILVARPKRQAQDDISIILDSIQRSVEVVGALLAHVGHFKRGLLQQLLAGQRRFAEFMSLEWREVQLGEVFDERCETGRDELPLLSITGTRGVIARDELVRRDSSAHDKSTYKRIAPGDIGYNTMRMWQGVSGLCRLDGIVSPAYTVVVPRRESILSEYAAHLFKSPRIIDRFRRFSQGLVDDTLNLKYSRFARVRVSLPSMEEQRRIAQVLDAADSELALLAKLRGELDLQRLSLLNRFFETVAHR